MAYFVTGATGFIGSYLVAKLIERSGPIYVLVRKQSLDRLAEYLEKTNKIPERTTKTKTKQERQQI